MPIRKKADPTYDPNNPTTIICSALLAQPIVEKYLGKGPESYLLIFLLAMEESLNSRHVRRIKLQSFMEKNKSIFFLAGIPCKQKHLDNMFRMGWIEKEIVRGETFIYASIRGIHFGSEAKKAVYAAYQAITVLEDVKDGRIYKELEIRARVEADKRKCRRKVNPRSSRRNGSLADSPAHVRTRPKSGTK